MHTFRVVKEPHGWAVRLDSGMSTPFWSRALAIQEANCLCDTLRSHGETAEVVIDEIDPGKTPRGSQKFSAARLASLLKSNRAARR
jgi:hypothetical protein